MFRSLTPARGRPDRPSGTAVALAAGLAVLVAGPTSAAASPPTSAGARPVVTRAALDPALVAGRGADVDFLEQEAENARTNGEIIGPDRSAYTLPAEASGRRAVRLTPGEYVEFVLPSAANGITVRYSIPDAPQGGGITAPLKVAVNGKHLRTMTSRRSTHGSTTSTRSPTTHRPGCCTRTGGSPSASASRRPPRRTRASARRSGPPTSTTSSGCCSGVPTGPATRSGSPRRPAAPPPGRSSTCSTPSWSHRRTSGCSRRTCSPSAPTRPAGGTPPTRWTGPSPSPGAPTSRCTSHRAPTRSTGTSSSTT